jgi:hypothetical protein
VPPGTGAGAGDGLEAELGVLAGSALEAAGARWARLRWLVELVALVTVVPGPPLTVTVGTGVPDGAGAPALGAGTTTGGGGVGSGGSGCVLTTIGAAERA